MIASKKQIQFQVMIFHGSELFKECSMGCWKHWHNRCFPSSLEQCDSHGHISPHSKIGILVRWTFIEKKGLNLLHLKTTAFSNNDRFTWTHCLFCLDLYMKAHWGLKISACFLLWLISSCTQAADHLQILVSILLALISASWLLLENSARWTGTPHPPVHTHPLGSL